MDKLIVENDEFFGKVVSLLVEGHSVTVPVKGVSMLPFIRGDKDSVVLEGVESCTPYGKSRIGVKVGDIVLFRYNGRYIMHRILRIENHQAVIQGDGVARNMEICSLDDIYGRVTQIRKNGKTPIDPYSDSMKREVALWMRFRPIRRYILFVYRHLLKF